MTPQVRKKHKSHLDAMPQVSYKKALEQAAKGEFTQDAPNRATRRAAKKNKKK